tara:strand:+ start:108 stop:329 length:222 start_codon:yes stop_codon:yes gene_type:complete
MACQGLCKLNPTPQGKMEHGDTNWNGIWRTGPLPHSSVSLCYLDTILSDNLSTHKLSYKLFKEEKLAIELGLP